MRDDPTQIDNPYTANNPSFGGNIPNNNIQSTNTDQIGSSLTRQVEDDQQIKPEPKKKEEPKRREINLPEEPAEDNTDALKIVLRMPKSGERIIRRFLKGDKL